MKKLFYLLSFAFVFLFFVNAQQIGDIQVDFCDEETSKSLVVLAEAGNDKEICVNIKNNAPYDVVLNVDFVDGVVSDQGNSVCQAPDSLDKEFSKYVQNYDNEIFLKGGDSIQKKYILRYPIGFSGLSHGCFSYYLDNNDPADISVVYRKVNTIDVLVGGVQVSSRINIKGVFYTGDRYTQKLGFKLENDGNIDQEISITGSIKSPFSYVEDFDLGKGLLGAGESVILYTNDLHIPNYKGLFYINSNISNQPYIDFSIAHSNIYSNEYSVAGTSLISQKIFLWNWQYVLLFLLISLSMMVWVIKLSNRKK